MLSLHLFGLNKGRIDCFSMDIVHIRCTTYIGAYLVLCSSLFISTLILICFYCYCSVLIFLTIGIIFEGLFG
jgi:hypothetical protein